jgi:hypothetical protein
MVTQGTQAFLDRTNRTPPSQHGSGHPTPAPTAGMEDDVPVPVGVSVGQDDAASASPAHAQAQAETMLDNAASVRHDEPVTATATASATRTEVPATPAAPRGRRSKPADAEALTQTHQQTHAAAPIDSSVAVQQIETESRLLGLGLAPRPDAGIPQSSAPTSIAAQAQGPDRPRSILPHFVAPSSYLRPKTVNRSAVMAAEPELPPAAPTLIDREQSQGLVSPASLPFRPRQSVSGC